MTFPDPLTPPDCDLRGMPYMELDVVRLLDSDFFALTTGDEFKAGVALWGKSWNQIPAASLPMTDRVLAHLAGVSHKEWAKLKEMALHGWVECADGRLYHPIVAEKALKAWAERQNYRTEKSAEAERKARERQDRADMFAALRDAGTVLPFDTKTKQLRALIAERGIDVHWTHAPKATVTECDQSQPERDLSQEMSQPAVTCHGPVTAKRGNGNGNGNGIQKEEEGSFALVGAEEPRPTTAKDAQIAFDEWNAMASRAGIPAARSLTDDRRRHIVTRLKEVGLDGWREALAKVAASPHCCGQNDRGWKADLDFLFQNRSWNRVLEGFYDARQGVAANQNRPASVAGWSAIDQAVDGFDHGTEEAA